MLKSKKILLKVWKKVIDETKMIMKVQPRLEKVFDEVNEQVYAYNSLKSKNYHLENEIESLNLKNKKLTNENNRLLRVIENILNNIKDFLREVLEIGNEKSKDLASNEVKNYYSDEHFDKNDVYHISRGTSKEDELFRYAEISDSYKEYEETYELDDNKYELLKTISKQINNNPDKKEKYNEILDDLENDRVINRYERRVCIQPIFGFTKAEVEHALDNIRREAEEAIEDYYRMNRKANKKNQKKHDDYEL